MKLLQQILQKIRQYIPSSRHPRTGQKPVDKNYIHRAVDIHTSTRTPISDKKSQMRFSGIFTRIGERTWLGYSGLAGVCGCITIGLCMYIFWFSPYFSISASRVLVSSTDDDILDTNMVYRGVEGVYGQRIWDIDTAQLTADIRRIQPQIQDVSISHLYPNGLKIVVMPSPVALSMTVHRLDKKYLLTQNGVILPYSRRYAPVDIPMTISSGSTYTGTVDTLYISGGISTTKNPTLFHLQVYTNTLKDETYLEYKKLLDERSIARIIEIKDIFVRTFPTIEIDTIAYYIAEREVHIRTRAGYTILFTLDNPLRSTAKQQQIIQIQISTLAEYFAKYPDSMTRKKWTYIDARIAESLYICEPEAVCAANMRRIYGE